MSVFVMTWQEIELFTQEWKFVREGDDNYKPALKTNIIATKTFLCREDRIKYEVTFAMGKYLCIFMALFILHL